MARGDPGADSDVDLLVRPLPGTSLLDLGGLLMDAEDLLGRSVDVVSERALTGALRERILGQAGIDWRRMAEMRDILVHAYLVGIDAETV